MIFLVHNHGTREDWNIFEHLLTNFSQGCDSSKIAFDTSNYTFISSIMWHRSSTNLCFDMPFQWWQKCRWSPDRWRRRRFVLACVANCIFPSVPCNFREPHLSPTWSPGCTDTLAWFGCTAFSRQIIKWTIQLNCLICQHVGPAISPRQKISQMQKLKHWSLVKISSWQTFCRISKAVVKADVKLAMSLVSVSIMPLRNSLKFSKLALV